MLIIQVVLIVGLLVGGALLLVASPTGARHLALRRLLLMAFVVFGVTAIVVPKTTSTVARWVGVGRGTDLLLYLLFVSFLAFVATAARRNRELERQVTVLTRRLALDEVDPPLLEVDSPRHEVDPARHAVDPAPPHASRGQSGDSAGP